MKKEKVDPKRPPVKDLQGHTYQHEVGDPDAARNIDRKLIRWRKDNSRQGRTRKPSQAATSALQSRGVAELNHE